MRRHGPGLFCVLLSVVASAGAAGCRGGRSRPPDPAPVNLRFTELTSLPTYLTNNPVAAVRDESLGWVLVTSTGLGPGKARTSIEDATWALPLADAQSDEDSRWRRLPAPPAGPRIGATMVALGDEL